MQISSERMKRSYDHNIFNNNYSKGDKVWYYKAERRPGLYPKFQRPWIGPITIIDRINDALYRIKIGPKSKPRVVHHNKLKPYRGDNWPVAISLCVCSFVNKFVIVSLY
jgi:hypothetical protein